MVTSWNKSIYSTVWLRLCALLKKVTGEYIHGSCYFSIINNPEHFEHGSTSAALYERFVSSEEDLPVDRTVERTVESLYCALTHPLPLT